MIRLKSLLKESLLNELEFGTQKAFDSYQKQHDLRGDTKVTVAGKKMSVSQAAKQSKPAAGKGGSVFGKSTATAKPKKLSGSDLETSAEKDKAPISHKTVSKLYNKMLHAGKPFDINDNDVDDEMEIIIKKVGHTPEQKKTKGFYKFATGGHPEFDKLTPDQLSAVTPFLKAVAKKGSYDGISDKWDGKKIIDNDEYDDDED